MRQFSNVERLSWDDWNLEHIAKHRVSEEDVEEVLAGAPVYRRTYKNRLQVIGPTRVGKILAVVIGPVPRQSSVYYAFSARPASRKERRYREERQEGIAE